MLRPLWLAGTCCAAGQEQPGSCRQQGGLDGPQAAAGAAAVATACKLSSACTRPACCFLSHKALAPTYAPCLFVSLCVLAGPVWCPGGMLWRGAS